MPGAIGDPRTVGPDVYVDMLSTNTTAMRGDYLAFSGKSVIAVATALPAAAFQVYSGIGIALANNPTYDEFGSASANGNMPVGTHRGGVFRVSAITGNYSAGQYCFPVEIGSGVVGQTGATGKAPLWSATAVPSRLTGSAFLPNSAVGQIVRVVAAGATGQWDIILLSPREAAAPLAQQ